MTDQGISRLLTQCVVEYYVLAVVLGKSQFVYYNEPPADAILRAKAPTGTVKFRVGKRYYGQGVAIDNGETYLVYTETQFGEWQFMKPNASHLGRLAIDLESRSGWVEPTPTPGEDDVFQPGDYEQLDPEYVAGNPGVVPVAARRSVLVQGPLDDDPIGLAVVRNTGAANFYEEHAYGLYPNG